MRNPTVSCCLGAPAFQIPAFFHVAGASAQWPLQEDLSLRKANKNEQTIDRSSSAVNLENSFRRWFHVQKSERMFSQLVGEFSDA